MGKEIPIRKKGKLTWLGLRARDDPIYEQISMVYGSKRPRRKPDSDSATWPNLPLPTKEEATRRQRIREVVRECFDEDDD
jgi:hypothetical protein